MGWTRSTLATSSTFQNQFLLARLEIVVVPQLLPGDDLPESVDAVRRIEIVHLELAGEPAAVEIGQRCGHCIDAQASCFAAQIDRAVIHRIAQVLAGIATDHHAPPLHHEAGEGAGITADDDVSALLVDTGAGTDRALADEIAASQCRAELRAGILLDDDRA